MLQSEKNSKKAKIIGKVTSNSLALKNAKVELKDLNKVVYIQIVVEILLLIIYQKMCMFVKFQRKVMKKEEK